MRKVLLVAVAVAVSFSIRCSKNDGPTSPTPTLPPTVTNYVGVLGFHSADAQTAAVTLIASRATTSTFGFQAPQSVLPSAVGSGTVTGTLTTPSGSSAALTGTVSAAGVFAVQGGGYTFTATLDTDGNLTGTGTAAGGTPISVSAVTSTASAPSVGFCGTYLGFYVVPGRPDEKEDGKLSFTITGTPYVTGFHSAVGIVPPSSTTAYSIPLRGYAQIRSPATVANLSIGSSVNMAIINQAGTPGSGAMDGVWVGDRFGGTFRINDGVGVSSGNWFARPAPCP